MLHYQDFHCTVRGYSHIRRGICCEDASCSVSDGDIHVIVVSDGHGDPACFRSQVGSRLAVEIAREKLLSFARNIREQHWEEQLFDAFARERLVRQLILSIVGNWNLRVSEELAAHPFTEEELADAHSYAPLYRAGQELPHIFGCTLIAAVITDRYLLALQQGDGRFVVVHSDGTADQPVPWDSRCVGNVCTSLCHPDAVESCRYYVADLLQDPVTACFALSDGIEDSLNTLDNVNAFVGNTASILLQEGRDALEQQLNDYLPRMSESGSSDDMSLAGIVDLDTSPTIIHWLELVYTRSNQQATLHSAAGKADSMRRKRDFLKSELEQAQTEYDRLNREIRENLSRIDRLRQELTCFLSARDSSTQALTDAEQKLNDAKTAYADYCAQRQIYVDRVQAAQADIQQTQRALDALAPQLPGRIHIIQTDQAPDWELDEAIIWDDAEDTAPAPGAPPAETAQPEEERKEEPSPDTAETHGSDVWEDFC